MMSQRRRDFHNRVDRTRSCLVDRAVAATGASVFDFHGSHRRKLIILRQKGHREQVGVRRRERRGDAEVTEGNREAKLTRVDARDRARGEGAKERPIHTALTTTVRFANKAGVSR